MSGRSAFRPVAAVRRAGLDQPVPARRGPARGARGDGGGGRPPAAGRGRLGRRWEAPAGSALLVLGAAAPALDARRALPGDRRGGPGRRSTPCRRAAGVDAALKWPNDLVVGGPKLAGILAEADAGRPGPGRRVRCRGGGRARAQRDAGRARPGAGGTSLLEATGRRGRSTTALLDARRSTSSRSAGVRSTHQVGRRAGRPSCRGPLRRPSGGASGSSWPAPRRRGRRGPGRRPHRGRAPRASRRTTGRAPELSRRRRRAPAAGRRARPVGPAPGLCIAGPCGCS